MNNAPHILVIDDEPQIQRAIRTILTEKGFIVSAASRGEEGLTLAAANKPDIVILDLGLPDMDGVEVCTRLRQWTQCPIIILSVRDSERDKVEALDKGADDYLTKPFAFDELLARLRALMRRPRDLQEKAKLECGTLIMDLLSRRIFVEKEEISLSQKEFSLLEYLLRRKGEVVSRTQIAEHVWDLHFDPMSNTIDVYINFLRKKIDSKRSQCKIETIRGAGYRLIEE